MTIKKRIKEKFSPYNGMDYLKSEKEMEAYLKVCMDEAGEDAVFIGKVLANITRTKHRHILTQASFAQVLMNIPPVGKDSDLERVD